MRTRQLGKTLNDRTLNRLIHPLRYLDNYTNLVYLALDYLVLVAVLVGCISFIHWHAAWGFSTFWCVPVAIFGVLAVGGVQHRFAGLGHEGAHYILLKNRLANELVSDLFCMFPIFSTTAQYRLIHLGHHEYTNDWERDPELLNLGTTRRMAEFPMSRWQFVYNFCVRIFLPAASLRYMWDNIYVTALGNGVHPYMFSDGYPKRATIGPFRVTSILGVGYLLLVIGLLGALSYVGTPLSLTVATLACLALAATVIYCIPENWFFHPQFRPVYSVKVSSMLRLLFITGMELSIAWAKIRTGFDWGVYFWLFWLLPLFSSFPYFMLLRDLYQHANADDGKLTNSRVIFVNPLLRWAMFIYGQDAHLTHHLYPAVPHYNLFKLHDLLKENNAEYAEHVVECSGMIFKRDERPTLLDCMECPTGEPLGLGAKRVLSEQDEAAA